MDTFKLKNKEVVRVDNIMFIESAGHYVVFHVKGEKFPIVDRTTMIEVQDALSNYGFLRTHRYYIVNLDHVRTVYHDRFILHNGIAVKISRTHKDRVKEKICSYS